MRFVIDAMLPPETCEVLAARGHDAVTPVDFGAHNLPDDVIVQLAAAEERVVVTENAEDFAHVTACTVLLVRKRWWPNDALAQRLAVALDDWAADNPEPGPWAHWLPADHR